MRTTSFLVAALVAATAVAEQARPKIYFPRHVKRQFSNVTITSNPPSSTPVDLTSPPTTKRQTLGESSENLSDPSASKTEPLADDSSSESNDGRVTTVVVKSTVFVSPPAATPAPDATSESDSKKDIDTGSTSSDKPTSSESTTDASDDPLPSSSDGASSGEIPPIIVLPTNRTTGLSGTTASASTSEAASSVEVEPSDSDSPVSKPPLPTGSTNTTTSDAVSESEEPTKTTITSSSGILLAPTGIVTSTSEKPPNPIESFLSSILNPDKPGNSTSDGFPLPTIIPSLSLTEPPSSSTDLPPIGTGGSSVPPESSTIPIPSSVPVGNSTSVPGPTSPGPTSVPPPIPTGGNSSSIPISEPPPTSVPAPTTLPVTNGTTISNSTAVPPPTTAPSIIIPVPAPTTDKDTDVTSVPPLSTVTNSQPWVPTNIILDPASTTVSGIVAPTSGAGVPTNLPKAINPESYQQPQPEDTTLIQIGFKNSLNYEFVVAENDAAAQIFRYLPTAVCKQYEIPEASCKVLKLVPLDTTVSLGYLTTLAVMSYPPGMVDRLQMDIGIPSSAVYTVPEELVYNLTQQINSAIDIRFGSAPGDSLGGPGSGGPGSGSGGNSNGDPFSDGEGAESQTSAQKGTVAGIALGSASVAAAYGAAMFLIARRYKRKKQAHRRSSSMTDPSDMRQTPRSSPALMGGALLSRDFSSYGGTYGAAGGRDSHGSGRSGAGNSGRTAYISAPVAAENSLGWN